MSAAQVANFAGLLYTTNKQTS